MSDPWFKFYPSDWLSGTRGLTPAETGVYVTLICMMYENDGQLARNDKRLARRCGCTSAAFKKIIANLLAEEKLTDNQGILTNARVQKELMERADRVQKASAAANHKWSKFREKNEQNQCAGHTPASPTQSTTHANNQNQSQTYLKRFGVSKPKGETPLQRVSRNLASNSLSPSPKGEAE